MCLLSHSVMSASLWPINCRLPGSCVDGDFQARILEWDVISTSKWSSWPRKLNPYLLHLMNWQADSLPLDYLGSPTLCSFQFSHSVVSNSLRPHVSQHARPPCPSPTPGFTQTHIHQVSDAIQPSHPLSSPSPPALSFPASGSFQMSQLFPSGGQSIGVSASKSVLPMNTQD